MRETYDELEWDIDEFPVSSSTPDDLFEVSFRARANCRECGNEIRGTANYWSREEDMSCAWLNNIDYDECEWCNNGNDEEEEEDYEDEFDENDL